MSIDQAKIIISLGKHWFKSPFDPAKYKQNMTLPTPRSHAFCPEFGDQLSLLHTQACMGAE